MTYDLTLRRFKEAVRRKEAPAKTLLRKASVAKLLVSDVEARQVRFTISTDSIDREGDTIALGGWNLSAFMQNPVVLWGHNASELPIGRAAAIGIEGGELRAVVDFVPADMPAVGEKAEAVLRMCREGFLSATSVGFRPTDFRYAEERMKEDDWWAPIDFLQQELLEFSIVSIPANPEALIDPSERAAVHLDVTADLTAVAQAAAVTPERIARRRLLLAACI
jgi:HK97 family phage prohead protease